MAFKRLCELLGGPANARVELARMANPITYFTADDPPYLLIHGLKGKIVPFNQSAMLHNALKDAGVESILMKVKNAGHGFRPKPSETLIKSSYEEILEIIFAFFDEKLGRS